MARRGNVETNQLLKTVEGQLTRLMTQMSDLEETRDEMEPDEYTQAMEETLGLMKDFEKSLSKLKDGDMSLVDSIGAIQLKIQAAISAAVNDPSEGKSAMFEKKGVAQLRGRLGVLEADLKAGRISLPVFKGTSLEILKALEREPGVTLTTHELELLKQAKVVDGFEKASSSSDVASNSVLQVAAADTRSFILC
jgi:hypothetical protein